MSESVVSQSTDQSTDSGRRVTRTYGRTHEDEMAEMRDPGCESNARGIQNEGSIAAGSAITPILWGRSPRFAEANGAKVIVTRDVPEPILEALAALTDAIQQQFGDAEPEDEIRRPMCRWHPGQVADFCGPCRSEEIGDAPYDPMKDTVPPPSASTEEGRKRARAIYDATRAARREEGR